MSILVRKMITSDLPRVLEILARWNMVPVAASSEIPDPEVAEIVLSNAFVAVVQDRIVGCASYFELGNGVCETASFAVDQEHTGCGVGLALHRARLAEMKIRGARRVITQTDRAATVQWYLGNFPYRVTGTNPKRHVFGDVSIDVWTVLELDLTVYDVE